MLAMGLGVDQKAERAAKLNRDAACDLYHNLILLARPVATAGNPSNVATEISELLLLLILVSVLSKLWACTKQRRYPMYL
jgi:hypothetical protein